MKFSIERQNQLLESFSPCCLCPHNCNVNRSHGKVGFCGCDSDLLIASICIHSGEEPIISWENGICNVFFGRCNLTCQYCQNHQISANRGAVSAGVIQPENAVDKIIECLEMGCHAVGFVSPTHFTPYVKIIIEMLRFKGYNPVFVYNTNCYDNPDIVKSLENYIDVYLPDFKYADDELAKSLSGVKSYKNIALLALKEMYRQKGSTLIMNEKGYIEKGLIVRHLVLPGYIENSKKVLHLLADISTSLAVSLMSQYFPAPKVDGHPQLSRKINPVEYDAVVSEFENLGFYKGWVQEMSSNDNYLPDFNKVIPFSD